MTTTQPTALSARQTVLPGNLSNRNKVQRILVIKLRHFGDVLLTTPLLSTLRVNYPNAQIDVLVYKGTEAMLAGNQDVFQSYTVDRNLKHQGFKEQFRGEKALWNRLRSAHYDLVVNLSDQWRAALYCRFLKPSFSLGFRYSKRNNWLWQACHSLLVATDEHQQQHTVLNNLDILAPLALPNQMTKVTQAYRQSDVDEIERLEQLHHVTRFVLVQPTARWAFKTWSIAGFTEVINHLTARGETVVLTGGRAEDEIAMIAAIEAGLSLPHQVINLAGRLELPELAVLIDRAKLFIGVDSVPMHMAAALQTPSVVLFGPSNLEQWSPWQVPHTRLWAGDYRVLPAPNEIDTDTTERYLDAIPAKDVIQAVDHHLMDEDASTRDYARLQTACSFNPDISPSP
ncbi:putative lipopolysaccharide heptosyltransferase III [Serratia sp. UGAL515B_01]|uniref:putative lipopolysaccharide heptosyltransferase III n=1 Tax=Serratia sp. UGAL515B_01 TaxID=2986763 RepID=UPI0029529C0C|nr:putative lipopolysaccharide heptosyltransferase III [Serratia sp. UGAL515B_01]WON76422.1 putative lipopolysaccharide heptosyltransferase III [Serratia sp. UGAL515B_01]